VSKKSKLNPLAEADNIRLLGELCVWIEKNIDTTLGIQELIEKTNLSSTDIQFLFERYKQTTPMTYVRKLRDARNKKESYIDKMRITPIFLDKD
jgi:transcriptional regulator GlxA family with amidase domain